MARIHDLLISQENFQEIARLIRKDKKIVNQVDKERNTPLIIASKNGYLDIAGLLLENGANVNDKNYHRYTALIFAAQNGYLDIVKLLIAYDANVDHQNDQGYTALMQAVQNGNLDLARLLIEKGANVDDRNDQGYTALSFAVANGYRDIAKLLIANGADIDNQNDKGYTALMQAVQNGNLDLARLLIKKGADVDLQNDQGYTALMQAVQNGNLDLAELLIDNGADVDNRDVYGNTALMLAAENGYLDIVGLLLENGANVDGQNHKEYTALSFAEQNGHRGVVKFLLDHKEHTEFMQAAENGLPEVWQLLLKKFANQMIEGAHSIASDFGFSTGKTEQSLPQLADKPTSSPISYQSNFAVSAQQILRAEGPLKNVLKITTGIDLSSYSLTTETKATIDFGLQLMKINNFTPNAIVYKILQTASYYSSLVVLEKLQTKQLESPILCGYEIGVGTAIGLSSASPILGAMNGLDICLSKHGIKAHETSFGSNIRYALDTASFLVSSVLVYSLEMSPVAKIISVVSTISLTDSTTQMIYALAELPGETPITEGEL